MVAAAVKSFGRLDYALNSAGVRLHSFLNNLQITKIYQIGVREPAETAEASLTEFQRFMNVNVVGTFLCVKAQSKAMKLQDSKPGGSRGVIINMGSAAAYTATPMLTQYTTSKHAVLGLTKSVGKPFTPYSFALLPTPYSTYPKLPSKLPTPLTPPPTQPSTTHPTPSESSASVPHG
jgi:NAD(P)-dependent dehydrogenase (short-subunit alcohol dehydrogenase family)